MSNILIFGAASAIAQATARIFAAKGDRFFLVARDSEKLRMVSDDLRSRGAGHVESAAADLTEYDLHQALIEKARNHLGGLDIIIIAHGTLPDQKACEKSFEPVMEAITVNALSVISLLTHLANLLEQQGHGTLCAISSPAGDRGRRSNYVYGAAKASVSIFMQGLRNRLYPSGIHVLTVKPGFVDTPMTAGFTKGLLWTRPEVIASGIYKAIVRKKDVVYLPWFWSVIMFMIRAMPEALYKRIRL
ncbi:MAG: SDR family oxidoreductase [Pseudomonadota bacterium]